MLISFILLLFIFITLLVLKWSDSLLIKEREEHKGSSMVGTEVELSAWITDWDWEDGLKDLSRIESNVTSIQLFGLYFDETESLYVPPHLRETIPAMIGGSKRDGVEVVLTIVNDRFYQDGSIKQKDPSIMTHLLGTEESRRRHIEDILSIVEHHQVDGVEIDYERVSEEDWPNLLLLYEELYHSLSDRGKLLRIVLEPRTPLENIKLPAGPTYVMMAYNLFGSHSGPGPKADFAFLRELSSRLKHVPGEPYFALATGGFMWEAQGRVRSVTETEAATLAGQSSASLQRDEASAAVVYEYTNELNQEQDIVWYADAVTLKEWMNVLKAEGYTKFALWRFGGLSEDTLQMLKKIE